MEIVVNHRVKNETLAIERSSRDKLLHFLSLAEMKYLKVGDVLSIALHVESDARFVIEKDSMFGALFTGNSRNAGGKSTIY